MLERVLVFYLEPLTLKAADKELVRLRVEASRRYAQRGFFNENASDAKAYKLLPDGSRVEVNATKRRRSKSWRNDAWPKTRTRNAWPVSKRGT